MAKRILYLFKYKIIYNFIIFLAKKNGRRKKSFPSLLFWCRCWIRDSGWIKIMTRDPGYGIKIPDPQRCAKVWLV
jgi:hypothetical protein